jgi:hypothetical protein
MIVINGLQVVLEMDTRTTHNNIISAIASSNGIQYWETVTTAYHINNHQLEVYATTYEGALSATAFIYYR